MRLKTASVLSVSVSGLSGLSVCLPDFVSCLSVCLPACGCAVCVCVCVLCVCVCVSHLNIWLRVGVGERVNDSKHKGPLQMCIFLQVVLTFSLHTMMVMVTGVPTRLLVVVVLREWVKLSGRRWRVQHLLRRQGITHTLPIAEARGRCDRTPNAGR
jgi:hypothetical protein